MVIHSHGHELPPHDIIGANFFFYLANYINRSLIFENFVLLYPYIRIKTNCVLKY